MLSRFAYLSFQEQSSFNVMAEVTIHSDFGGQENKMIHTQGKIEKLLTILPSVKIVWFFFHFLHWLMLSFHLHSYECFHKYLILSSSICSFVLSWAFINHCKLPSNWGKKVNVKWVEMDHLSWLESKTDENEILDLKFVFTWIYYQHK